jgi:DNA polymerase-3 subunit alpha
MLSIKHNLSCKSDFSIGESTMMIGPMVEKAKERGYDALALVDTMNVSGVVDFTARALKAGIKPVMGCAIRVFDDPTYRPPAKSSVEKAKPNNSYILKVYVKTEEGFKGLLKLLSKANDADHFYYTSRASLDDVLALTGVAVSTGDLFNLFHHPDATKILGQLAGHFNDDLYVEYVALDTPLFKRLNRDAAAGAATYGLPMLITRPTLYLNDGDAGAHDVLRAITGNRKMGSRTLPVPYYRDLFLKNPGSQYKGIEPAFAKAAVLSACKLIDSCDFVFKKLPPCLPQMAENEFVALTRLITEGWKERFSREVLGHRPTADQLDVYKARLQYELGVLKKMNFAGYFLLVRNIVEWSKTNGIIVGPGRGSAGGSLVSYLLGITDVDPIRFDLLFERFINPDRIDLPDVDLDFMSSRRHEVIEYIIATFGQENVAGISNYSTLGAASALRDTSRVHELNPIEYACSKQMEKIHGNNASLEESAAVVPDIAKFKDERPVIWDYATKLEGVMRNLGQHAAGIVVAGEPLVNRSVVETRSGGAVVNWDKRTVEELGLIKMDILGLSTLDILKLAVNYIKERHGKRIDLLRLPLDEPQVMRAFGKGETVGVFQFESPGMRKLLKELAEAGTLTFDDLVAVVALYRPGPLDAGLCDDYVSIKQGAKHAYYEHDNMKPALVNTHGVIIYQEQVMQIARDVAGYTMPDADKLRKIMGKKDKDEMAKQREKWVDGCVAHSGMAAGTAERLFDKIEVFAGYAFNKSHSVEYSVISYWTMWVKAMYPAEFYAATMSVVDDSDKLTALVLDAQKAGMKILPPDINFSTDRIEIQGENELYAPLQTVKGISSNVAAKILEARLHWFKAYGKKFASRAEFDMALVESGIGGKVNKAHKDRLERVGAFATITEGSLPALHESRLKDRLELLPGITVEAVKADRGLTTEKLAVIRLTRMLEETAGCAKCSLAGTPHAGPRLGKKPKFMMVFDAPTFKETKAGKMLEGDAGDAVKAALKEVGLTSQDGYFTSLVKAAKPAGEKVMATDCIVGCSEYLRQEIEILKPAVIIAMGGNSIRYFSPGVKGSPADLAGKAIFDPKLDATIVYGLNPGSIYFNPGNVKHLQAVVAKIADIIS